MKYILMAMLFITVFIACNRHTYISKTPYVNLEIKNKDGDTILVGHCMPYLMQTGIYKDWYDKNYNNYKVDTAIIQETTSLLKDKRIEIFLGTWCGDTKKHVPKMMKVLQAAKFDTTKLRVIFVDESSANYKQSPQHEEKGKNIHHVPTFILYDHKGEMNRIVEDPVESLEKDILKILKKEQYQPKYEALTWWQKNVRQKDKDLDSFTLAHYARTLKTIVLSMGDFNTYGRVLLAEKKFKEALNVFKLNSLLFPDRAHVFFMLASTYQIIGNKKKAVVNYRKVLELRPDHEQAKKMLQEL